MIPSLTLRPFPNSFQLWDMTVSIKAAGAETNGLFCIVERTLPPYYRKEAPHWHAATTEAFYVVDGALTFTLDDQTFIAQRGSVVVVSPRTVHLYWNSTASPVTFLTTAAPGGLECLLAELSALFAKHPYEAMRATEVAARYDHYAPAENDAC
ncbi:MAG: cupin domain-containing protein [Caldilineaceae bacterium]